MNLKTKTSNNAEKTAITVAGKLTEKKLTVSLAESCTGGLVGHILTNIAGSTAWFQGGVIAYNNSVKENILGVSPGTIKKHGAVSKETAMELACGARGKLGSDIAVAITGIAGPGGGTEEKPVGTVFVAVTDGRGLITKRLDLKGARAEIKEQAARAALKELLKFIT